MDAVRFVSRKTLLSMLLVTAVISLSPVAAHAACGDQRDTIIAEYVRYGVSFVPTCASFTKTGRSVYFTFTELNTGDYSWARLRAPFLAPASSGYGMDKWRTEYGGPRYVNSAYRNPARNARVGGAKQSRHMWTDAADLRNVSGTTSEYNAMVAAAKRAHADYIEPTTLPCGIACTHADWRYH